MSKLTFLLKSSGETLSAFAKRVGISQNYLSEINNGRKLPSGSTAYAIEMATDGAIPTSYWFSPDGPGQTIIARGDTKSNSKLEGAA